MKITSMTFVDNATIPLRSPRNTQLAQDVKTILEKLAQGAGKGLEIAADGVEKYTRYSLQKALQKAGAKVVVVNGTDAKGKEVLKVRRLSDAEWKEYIKS